MTLWAVGAALLPAHAQTYEPQVIINELMYHPYESWPPSQPLPTPNPTEYVEIYNRGTATVDLAQYRFDNGISFDFPAGAFLPAKQFLVITENLAAFATAYPTVTNVIGDFSGALANSGERVTLSRREGGQWVTEDTISYIDDDDSDGTGRSLELIHPGYARLRNQYFGDWAASLTTNGTPGRTNSVYNPNALPVVGDVAHHPPLPPAGSAVRVTARVTGINGDALSQVLLEYRKDALAQQAWNSTLMNDAGEDADFTAADGIFAAWLPPTNSPLVMAEGEILEFRIRATDTVGNRTFPATNRTEVVGGPYSYLIKFAEDNFDDCAYPGEYDTFHILMTAATNAHLEARHLIDAARNDNYYNDTPLDATIIAPGGQIFYNSGTRYRGGSSRQSLPRNWRMDIPRGMDWQGYNKINLNHLESLRQHTGMVITDWATGGYAFDSGLARLYVNNQRLNPTHGIFHRFENFGAGLMNRVYDGDTSGNRYSADGDYRLGYLQYVDDNPSSYTNLYYITENNPHRAWHEMVDLSRDLAAPVNELPTTLTNRMNTRQWSKLFATQAALDNGEAGFLAVRGGGVYGDEVRLAVNPKDGRFDIYPWDYDDVIGQSASLWGFSGGVASPNVQKFLFNRPILPYYVGDVHTIMTTIMTQEKMTALFDGMGSKMVGLKPTWLSTINTQRTDLLNQIFTNLTVTGLADGATVLTLPSTNLGSVTTATLDQNTGGAGAWRLLGTLSMPTSAGATVTLTRMATHPNHGANTVADAIMLSNSVAGVVILNDGDAGFGVSGVWSTSPTGGYNNGPYRYTSGLSTFATATWRGSVPQLGDYDVYAWVFTVPGSNSELISRYGLGGSEPHVLVSGLTGRAPQNYTDRVLLNDNDAPWDLRANTNQGLWSMTSTLTLPGDVAALRIEARHPEGQVLRALDLTVIGRRTPQVRQGTISAPTVWSSASGILLVTNTVTVQSGTTLTIAPDAVVVFAPGRQLVVNGTLNVQGPAQFLPEGGTTGWKLVVSGASASATISNAVFRQGTVSAASGAQLRLFDTTIEGHTDTNGIVSANNAGWVQIERCVVRNYTRTRFTASPTLIADSLFEGMRAVGIDFEGTAATATVRRTTLRAPWVGTLPDGIVFAGGTAGLVTNVWVEGLATGVVARAAGVRVADTLLDACVTGLNLAGASSVATRGNTIVNAALGIQGAPTVTNTIIWSVGTSIAAGPAAIGYSDVAMPGNTLYTGPANLNREPFFKSLEDRDYRLLPISPCLGAGLGSQNMGAPYPTGANPLPPHTLIVTATDSNAVTLAWTAGGADAAGYELWRATGAAGEDDAQGAWALAGTTAAGVTAFTDTGLPQNTLFRYRARAVHARGASTWTEPAEAVTTFLSQTQLLVDYLRLTEINYNPPGPEDDTEFLEFKNISTNLTLDLSGAFLDNGRWVFTNGTTLAPQAFFVLVRDPVAYQAMYPGKPWHGAYLVDDRLDNGGETLFVKDAAGVDILRMAYDDDPLTWYATTDGFGYTLVPLDPNPSGDASNPLYWRASTTVNGSPGEDDPEPPYGTIVINEILAHTDPPLEDAVELYNAGTNAVDIAGWFLSDRAEFPRAYTIPGPSLVLPPGGYHVFYEGISFNADSNAPGSFTFSSLGEGVYLSSGDGTNLTSYRTGFEFSASFNGVTFGRHLRSDGQADYPPLVARTFGMDNPATVEQFRTGTGLPNAAPYVPPVVINEIMYAPATGGRREYIELYNRTGSAVPLYDPGHPSNTWRLRQAVSYTFPEGIVMAPHEHLLITHMEPDEFRAEFGLSDPSIRVLGPFDGRLDNDGESVELFAPDSPDAEGMLPYVRVDRVDYRPTAPWPTAAAGTGPSLERIDPAAYGNDPINWVAGTFGGTPGQPNNTAGLPAVGFPVTRDTRVETNETIQIAVSLLPPVDAMVTVDYGRVGGSATPGIDFTFTPGTLTFWPWETNKFIPLTIINDDLAEPNETIEITLSNITANARLGGNRNYTLTLLDNDAGALAAPVILPANTTDFTNLLQVTIVPTVAGSHVRYTLDNRLPDGDAPLYTGPFTLTTSARVTARTFLGDLNQGGSTSVLFRAQAGPSGPTPTNTAAMYVSASADDGVQGGPSVYLGFSTIRFGQNGYWGALHRFVPNPANGIPRGAVITNAYMQLTSATNNAGARTFTIQAQAADHAAPLVSISQNISSRPRTAAAVAWSPPDWNAQERGPAQRTPNLSALIQEVIDRPGWQPTNALAIITVFGSGTIEREAWAFEGFPVQAAMLYIQWADNTNTSSQYLFTVQASGPGQTFGGNSLYPAGSNASAVATPEARAAFTGWSGDVGAANTNQTALEVLMNMDRSVTAHFMWLPPDPPAVLEIPSISNGTFTLRWLSMAPYLYSVHRSTNLVVHTPGDSLANGLPADPTGTNTWTDPAAPAQGAFYTIGASEP